MASEERLLVTDELMRKADFSNGFEFSWIDEIRLRYPDHSNLRFKNTLGPLGYGMGNNICALLGDRPETNEEYLHRIAEEELEVQRATDRRARGVDLFWVVSHRVQEIVHSGILKRMIETTEEDARNTCGVVPTFITALPDYDQPGSYDVKWFCPDRGMAMAFVMLVSGKVSEYEWPIKVSDLDEEQLLLAYYEHVVSKF
jgi:hypothetical protein